MKTCTRCGAQFSIPQMYDAHMAQEHQFSGAPREEVPVSDRDEDVVDGQDEDEDDMSPVPMGPND